MLKARNKSCVLCLGEKQSTPTEQFVTNLGKNWVSKRLRRKEVSGDSSAGIVPIKGVSPISA